MLTHGQKKSEANGRMCQQTLGAINLEISKCDENIFKIPPNLVSQPRKNCHWPNDFSCRKLN